MGFFARVGSDVAGLMLKSVKRFIAHGAFVRARGGVLPSRFLLCRHHDGKAKRIISDGKGRASEEK